METGLPRIIRPRWTGAILVCNKCLKRHDDGKALRRALRKAGRALSAGSKRRKLRIIKTSCLGICPKQAVVVASATTLAENTVVVVRSAAEMKAAARRLLPDGASQ